MSKPRKTANKYGRAGNKISLHPLTPDQAMGAILKVKLSDVRKLEEREKKAGKNSNGKST